MTAFSRMYAEGTHLNSTLAIKNITIVRKEYMMMDRMVLVYYDS